DGIRDFHVTGVQTCALPISLRAVFTVVNVLMDTKNLHCCSVNPEGIGSVPPCEIVPVKTTIAVPTRSSTYFLVTMSSGSCGSATDRKSVVEGKSVERGVGRC